MIGDYFLKTCPKCQTVVRITEVGEKFPSKTCDTYHCPACGETLGQKNTLYWFEETIEFQRD